MLVYVNNSIANANIVVCFYLIFFSSVGMSDSQHEPCANQSDVKLLNTYSYMVDPAHCVYRLWAQHKNHPP